VSDRFVDDARSVAANDEIYDLEESHSPEEPRVRRIKTPHLHDRELAAIRGRYTIIMDPMAGSVARSTRRSAISISHWQCRVSARPTRSPCITCAPCTAQRPISPVESGCCCCSNIERPTLGRCSASPAELKNSTSCCLLVA
jgi:hypothetical protein